MAAQDTPVMQQHARAKLANPNCIIFFRLGDFYEMFGDDAVLAAPLLDLTLTSRNRGKPDEIPMAGVPHHAAHSYIARLLDRGHRVALCEQMADPKMVRGIVPREVVRIVTPATWSESPELGERENNFLGALELGEGGQSGVALAVLDVSTAELRAIEVPNLAAALAEFSRLGPREIVMSGASAEAFAEDLGRALPRAFVRIDNSALAPAVLEQVDGAEAFSPSAKLAVQRVLSYARACFPQQELTLFRVAALNATAYLELGLAAQSHLELLRSNSGIAGTTLLEVLDRTRTASGARLLRSRLQSPLLDLPEIRARLGEVRTLFDEDALRKHLGQILAQVPDLERLSVKLAYGEASPKDLGAIRRSLVAAREVMSSLSERPNEQAALRIPADLDVLEGLEGELALALVDRPPAQAKEGAIFRAGYDAQLDRLAGARMQGSSDIAAIESTLRDETGIGTLRVKYTRVFGWYIEVSRAQSSRVPAEWSRKQTVAAGERYTTPRLDELAATMLESEELFRARELELFHKLLQRAQVCAPLMHRLAHVLGALDVSLSLAEVAREYDYVEPKLQPGTTLRLEGARHPVVERMPGLLRFVPNDVDLSSEDARVWLITGPNMAGKSTFLRQTALAVVMAQMGSFVAAKAATLGVVDKVLSRLGASDNVALGESTFMVEMRETAHILRSATRSSLVIIDEIGRGTSTFDGMAIAWSVLEYLAHEVNCRSLFATHYQELTYAADLSRNIQNHCVLAKEEAGSITFLHRVVRGAAGRSYGVQVAELAGLPPRVVADAKRRLAEFERGTEAVDPADRGHVALEANLVTSPPSGVTSLLRELELANVETWNGLRALEFAYALKSELGRGAAARDNRS
jgi:DNA mismatch repair protein MutS